MYTMLKRRFSSSEAAFGETVARDDIGPRKQKNKKDRIDETNKWATSSIRHLHESGHLRNVKQRWNFEDPNEVAKVISRASICVNMAKQKQGGKKTKKSKRSSNGAGKRRKKTTQETRNFELAYHERWGSPAD
eukprot:TRINITY_DN9169_c0_g1_i2.p1 TRINITY_DN9169_c0_g1~~TRINITY_DN9169_c0_g1_i2.p1  ORF type:complete len:133 (+),score=31.30 TRINITY_DN9169_c0_g1_i2:249-647(+)